MQLKLATFILISVFSTNLFGEYKDALNLNESMSLFREVADTLIGKTKKYKIIVSSDKESSSAVYSYIDSSYTIKIGEENFKEAGSGLGALILVCHEIGHVVKSFQIVKNDNLSGGVSSEDMADYWSTKECMAEMLKKFPNIKNTQTSLDSEFKKACEKFPNQNDQDICFQSLQGSYLFREPGHHKDLCNSQKLSFKNSEAELSRTPYKGKRPPNLSQCSFNNLVAGALNFKQPACYSLMMMTESVFGENCGPGSLTNLINELGREEEDSVTDVKAISNIPRSTHVDKRDEIIENDVSTKTISK